MLRAVLHCYVRTDAPKFTVSAFVAFLETTPSAHVKHENCAEDRLAALNGTQEFL